MRAERLRLGADAGAAAKRSARHRHLVFILHEVIFWSGGKCAQKGAEAMALINALMLLLRETSVSVSADG